jgi:dihydrofolate synthase / folylpolyglutamate synthase
VSVIGTGAYGRALDALSARGPGRMVPDRERIRELVTLLGDPQAAFRSIHVTGTNGKGSTVRIASAVLEALGLRTGTYVSPHLHDVRERIMVGLRPIAPEVFAEVHAEVDALARLLDERTVTREGDRAQSVTFFELMTAMAFAHFADEAVDVGVIEVGMGGLWDATNVMDGDVAVIGEVDLDHTILGGTPEEIAREKVGIIKPGARVVSAAQTPEVAAVVSRAVAEAGADLAVVGHELVLVGREPVAGGQRVSVDVRGRRIDDLLLPLRGEHQARNLLLAVGAVEALLGPSFAAVSDDALQAGVAAARVPGRLEVVREGPTVVVDAAHNPHAAHALVAGLRESFRFRDVILVVACLDDKDVEGILAALAPVASHVVVTVPPSERAASLERMRGAAAAVFGPRGVHVESAPDVAHALDLAMSITGPADAVVVTGSITTIGAAREHLQPSDEMRAEADHADAARGLRTLLVGLDAADTDALHAEDDDDVRGGQDGYGDDGDDEGFVLD